MTTLNNLGKQGLAKPRTNKTNLPVNETLEVAAHKRAKFLGPGGLNLKRLTSETGVQVTTSYDDLGVFRLFAPNAEAMAEARLVIPAMLGMETRELLAEFAGEEAADLLMHFSMWPFSTSRLLNLRPQSWQG